MNYLVTGGCGFIGSHLTDALVAAGHHVRVLDDLSTGRLENLPPSAEFIRGSVADRNIVRRAMQGMDGCFHLAAIASVMRCEQDWAGTHATNLGGLIAVLEAVRERKLPVVYASSAAVYGDAAPVPANEGSPVAPISAYGADKRGCELHAGAGTASFGIPTLGLRLFNVYGPRQDGASPYSGVISAFCDRLSQGAPITIWGDGQQTRDFVYVGDVVTAMLTGMARLPDTPRVINVCTGRAISVLELARVIGGLCGVRPVIDHRPGRVGDIAASRGDPSLLHAALGVVAGTTLAEGLRHTVARASLAA
jgi:UDP-glucose 4-epimerase